ncbi:MAG: hypothetical protein U0002_03370 [Thermoanaerobaculia bacterium]
MALSSASASLAQEASAPSRGLAERSIVDGRLVAHPAIDLLGNLESSLAPTVRDGWAAFRLVASGEWQAYVDRRTGRLEYAEGAGIPWIPGRGNSLTPQDLAPGLRSGTGVDLGTLEKVARGFVPQVSALLGLDGLSLVLNRGRSGEVSPNVWFVDFDVALGGKRIEGARVVFRVNHGNLIQFGTENLPAPGAKLPVIRVAQEQAYRALGDYLGGFAPGDKWLDRGGLHYLPASISSAAAAEGFLLGQGREVAAVWQFEFNRPGELGTWLGRVDAVSGQVVEFYDRNEYGQVTGGAYPQSPSVGAEVVRAMPFANVATGVFANSAGLFSGTTGTTTLNGQYVAISDTCGTISKAADATGAIALGTSTGTDCTTPGSGGAGNTHASRTQFYHVNRSKEVGRGWLPSNAWLSAKLTVNVNLNQTCNAYWNGSTLNFFKSGGGCGNTGEIAAVSLHEYGHGLDSNDGNGSSADNGTGETYGDFTAALATHSSCIGPGFRTTNCTGNGDACTSCTGVRDIDWAKHTSNTPHTVPNFIQARCPLPSANNPNYVGPCGKDAIARGNTANKREGHCESYVSSEALWDLANRDLPSPGTGAAWSTTDRLWYLSRSTATSGFQCNTSVATWTSDGCLTGSYFRAMRAVDDDNGNLADGTPHGGAIFAAFNRHNIACSSDAGASLTFAGCTPSATPALTLTGGNNTVSASWTSSGAGVVYDLYRNESSCNAGFTKIANDSTSTSATDNAVGNGTTYFYQVVAHPSGNEACAGAPSVCVSVTPSVGTCTPPGAPTGLTATGGATQVSLSWTAVAGATEYHILRSTTSGGPYTQVGTSTTTSFVNTGLACNTTYFYVVRAANSATCESANSAQASATTNTCTCTTTTLYNNNFDAATGLSDWTRGTFVSGGSVTDWRGVQACTAASGANVFRFGGTACTTDYVSNDFNFAQPNGATGITIPAGSTTARLTFSHRRDFESGFDGGTLAISTDGTNYTFVPATAILSGTTYNGTVSASCPPAGAAGTAIFTGTATAFSTTTVDLDAACNAIAGNTGGCAGKSVRIAFTTISDCSVTGDGWFLDNVSVSACTP